MGGTRLAPAAQRAPGGVQRLGDAGEVRRADGEPRERIEQRDAQVALADDRGEVGGRVARTPPCGADRAQHPHLGRQRGQVQRIHPRMRDDGVEDEPGDPLRVREGIALGDERAVGGAVENEARGADGPAQVLDVGNGGRRGEVRPPGAKVRAQASTAPGGGGVRSEAPSARWRAGQSSASSPVPR